MFMFLIERFKKTEINILYDLSHTLAEAVKKCLSKKVNQQIADVMLLQENL